MNNSRQRDKNHGQGRGFILQRRQHISIQGQGDLFLKSTKTQVKELFQQQRKAASSQKETLSESKPRNRKKLTLKRSASLNDIKLQETQLRVQELDHRIEYEIDKLKSFRDYFLYKEAKTNNNSKNRSMSQRRATSALRNQTWRQNFIANPGCTTQTTEESSLPCSPPQTHRGRARRIIARPCPDRGKTSTSSPESRVRRPTKGGTKSRPIRAQGGCYPAEMQSWSLYQQSGGNYCQYCCSRSTMCCCPQPQYRQEQLQQPHQYYSCYPQAEYSYPICYQPQAMQQQTTQYCTCGLACCICRPEIYRRQFTDLETDGICREMMRMRTISKSKGSSSPTRRSLSQSRNSAKSSPRRESERGPQNSMAERRHSQRGSHNSQTERRDSQRVSQLSPTKRPKDSQRGSHNSQTERRDGRRGSQQTDRRDSQRERVNREEPRTSGNVANMIIKDYKPIEKDKRTDDDKEQMYRSYMEKYRSENEKSKSETGHSPQRRTPRASAANGSSTKLSPVPSVLNFLNVVDEQRTSKVPSNTSIPRASVEQEPRVSPQQRTSPPELPRGSIEQSRGPFEQPRGGSVEQSRGSFPQPLTRRSIEQSIEQPRGSIGQQTHQEVTHFPKENVQYVSRATGPDSLQLDMHNKAGVTQSTQTAAPSDSQTTAGVQTSIEQHNQWEPQGVSQHIRPGDNQASYSRAALPPSASPAPPSPPPPHSPRSMNYYSNQELPPPPSPSPPHTPSNVDPEWIQFRTSDPFTNTYNAPANESSVPMPMNQAEQEYMFESRSSYHRQQFPDKIEERQTSFRKTIDRSVISPCVKTTCVEPPTPAGATEYTSCPENTTSYYSVSQQCPMPMPMPQGNAMQQDYPNCSYDYAPDYAPPLRDQPHYNLPMGREAKMPYQQNRNHHQQEYRATENYPESCGATMTAAAPHIQNQMMQRNQAKSALSKCQGPITTCKKQARSVTFEDECGMNEIISTYERCRSGVDWERVNDIDTQEDNDNDVVVEDDNDYCESQRSSSSVGTELTCREANYDDDYLTCDESNQMEVPPFNACPCMYQTYLNLAEMCTARSDDRW